jgi:hypothetical protein
LGLALRGGGALERRVGGLPRMQTRNPFCRPGAHLPNSDGHRGLGGGGRRPGSVSAAGPGTQYLSDHFQNLLQYRGINPSFAFIEQPQTNGVAERFIRTLKEQLMYGLVFQNLEEMMEAVRRFVNAYNREWPVEKTGYQSPWQARAQWLAQNSIARAA